MDQCRSDRPSRFSTQTHSTLKFQELRHCKLAPLIWREVWLGESGMRVEGTAPRCQTETASGAALS